MNNKILLFSRDPGAANCIIKVYLALKQLNKYQIILAGKATALKVYEQATQDTILDLGDFSNEAIKEMILNEKIGLVLTGTSANDATEKYLWKIAKELDIISMAILDQWVNYGIRFSEYNVDQIALFEKQPVATCTPHYISVMDAYSKEKIIQYGIDPSQIIITGNIHLEGYIQSISEIIKTYEMPVQYQNLQNQGYKVITFASEPISHVYGSTNMFWGYNEMTIRDALLDALEQWIMESNEKVLVIIRPHPKETNLIEWNKTYHFPIFIDRDTLSPILQKYSQCIIGMSSMFLLESALLGTSIMSIQIGLTKDDPFILSEMNILKSITAQEDIIENLKEMFHSKQLLQLPDWGNAINKTVEFVEEIYGKTCY